MANKYASLEGNRSIFEEILEKLGDLNQKIGNLETKMTEKINTLEINMATKDDIKNIRKDLENTNYDINKMSKDLEKTNDDIKNLNHDINVIKYKNEYNNVNMTPSTFDEALSSAAIFGRTRPVNSIYEE